MKANNDLRKVIYANQLRMWEIAYEIGITNSTFSIWLRTPLNDERKAKVEKAINSLIEKGGN